MAKHRCLQGGRLVAKGGACKLWRRERDGGKELGGGMEGQQGKQRAGKGSEGKERAEQRKTAMGYMKVSGACCW